MRRLLREPLFHFAVIGGLIFMFFAAVDDAREAPTDLIVITPERIEQIVTGFGSVWMREPTDDELDALIEETIREEVYYREAVALGLDTNDVIVRRRMRQKMEFFLDTGSYLREPAEGELETYFAANEEAYRRGASLAFEQIYLGEVPAPDRITRSLRALRSDSRPDPSTLAEPTLLPAQLSLSPPSAVDDVFGKGFFDRIAELPPGEWSGPVASAFGVHLVRTLDGLPARMPPLDQIRDAVLKNWREAKAREIRDQDYLMRRERFVVEIRRGETRTAENR